MSKMNSNTSGKRTLSDNNKPTGESPDAKKQFVSRTLKMQMPHEDAPASEWFKALFMKMEEMSDQYDELKQSLEDSLRAVNECKKDIGNVQTEMDDLKEHIGFLKCENQDLKVQLKQCVENNLKTEIHLREQNLVFEGIKETYGEHDELLYNRIVQVLDHMMVFHECGSRVPIGRLHRVGPYIKGQTRPVVVHFMRYPDVQLLMKNRSQLPEHVFVREDFPPEIENRRRILRPIFNKARKMAEYKGKCRLMSDKLILNGKAFTVEPLNNLDTLPKALQPRAAAEREDENVIVFFTQGSPFSNFHHSPFVKNNARYCCNEQFIQASKAEMFDDDNLHAKIMQSRNPYEIKKLGRSVRNFVKQRWDQEAKKIAIEGCLAKFSQNAELFDALMKTGKKTIGEASTDPIWGIGKSLDGANVLDPSGWTGENVLGNALMSVREQLQ